MACCAHLGPHESPASFFLTLIFLLCFSWASQDEHPQVAPIHVWELRNAEGKVINSLPTTGQPIFSFDLCDLFGENWNGANWSSSITKDGGCGSINRESRLWDRPYYVCPREGRSNDCRGENYFFCGLWGECLTASPVKDSDKHLEFTRVTRLGAPTKQGTCNIGDCNPVEIKVKTWHETETWTGGRMWGIRIVFTGKDPGALFTIKLKVKPWSPNPAGPLRPILLDQNPGGTSPNHTTIGKDQNGMGTAGGTGQGTNHLPDVHPRVKTLVRSVELVYTLLNDSAPNVTCDCWLCLHPEPPYYIGVAAIAEIGTSKGNIRMLTLSSGNSNSPECKWGTQLHQVTLGEIQGKGTCFVIANYKLDASPYRGHCTQVIKANKIRNGQSS